MAHLLNEIHAMGSFRSSVWAAQVLLVTLFLAGCGSSKPGGTAPPDYTGLAKQKVAAVQKMADGAANDPSGVAVLGAYEEFVNLPLEVKDHPDEAREILDIYNKRLRGKLRGEVADQMQRQMAQYQALLARTK